MRQAGVLAAAGIVALTSMVDRLAEDHANAQRLAEGLAETRGIRVEVGRVRTNIVYFQVEVPGVNAPELVRRLAAEGVKVLPTGPRQMRAVTHHPLTADDVEAALEGFRRAVS
jgi:threonine aldolase